MTNSANSVPTCILDMSSRDSLSLSFSQDLPLPEGTRQRELDGRTMTPTGFMRIVGGSGVSLVEKHPTFFGVEAGVVPPGVQGGLPRPTYLMPEEGVGRDFNFEIPSPLARGTQYRAAQEASSYIGRLLRDIVANGWKIVITDRARQIVTR